MLISSLLRKIRLSDQRGYSLWELGISTAVLGVLGTTMIGIMSQKKENARVALTMERLEKIQSALDSYSATQGFLPCPSLPALPESDVNFGKSEGLTLGGSVVQASNYDASGTHACTANGLNLGGAVPVRTLNLADTYTYDGWGQKFTYRISDNAGNATDYGTPGFRGTLRVVDLKGNEKTSFFEPAPNNNGATYVVISHGVNGGKAAWKKDSVTAPTLTIDTSYEASNINHAKATYVQNEKAKGFDDIVVFGMYTKIKSAYAPFAIPKDTCANAESIAKDAPSVNTSPLNALKQLTGEYPALATSIYNAARSVQGLCNATPEKIDTTLALVLNGSDPNPDVVQDGGRVSVPLPKWVDTSGYGNHALQPNTTDNIQPSFIPYAFKRHGGIRFDGNDYMDIPYNDNLNRSNMTLFIVSQSNKSAGNTMLISSRQANTGSYAGFSAMMTSLNSLQALVGPNNTDYLTVKSTISFAKPSVLTLQYAPNEQKVFINSVLASSTKGFIYGPAGSPQSLRIGSDSSGTYGFVGDIGEIRLYPALLPEDLRQRVEGELAKFWDVGVN